MHMSPWKLLLWSLDMAPYVSTGSTWQIDGYGDIKQLVASRRYQNGSQVNIDFVERIITVRMSDGTETSVEFQRAPRVGETSRPRRITAPALPTTPREPLIVQVPTVLSRVEKQIKQVKPPKPKPAPKPAPPKPSAPMMGKGFMWRGRWRPE